MRLSHILALLTCQHLAAQFRASEFQIYPAPNTADFATRGTLGNNPGEILMEVPATHFSGIGQDNTGTGTILIGFRHVLQERASATGNTYSLLVRRGTGGRPSTDSAGILMQTSTLTGPPSSGNAAWIITYDLATPSAALPTCDTFYFGVETSPATSFTGLAWHMVTTGGPARGDNPAESPLVPNLAWDRVSGSLVPRQPPVCAYNMSVRVLAPVLNVGNVDPSWSNGSAINFTSYGLGGMWPQVSGTRSDGLACRVRDANNANGSFVVFASSGVVCPGSPLGNLATGALYLTPSVLVPVASASLTNTGEGTALIAAPASLPTALSNHTLHLQAFTLGIGATLPGHLSNRASTRFL
ncbi:MAG: hypothetical protein R3F56_21220 [Planctomycetota bacterium]